MSKYIKLEDAVNILADLWRFEQEMEYSDTAEDIEGWRKVARKLFADLPTIEVETKEQSRSEKWYKVCKAIEGLRTIEID